MKNIKREILDILSGMIDDVKRELCSLEKEGRYHEENYFVPYNKKKLEKETDSCLREIKKLRKNIKWLREKKQI